MDRPLLCNSHSNEQQKASKKLEIDREDESKHLDAEEVKAPTPEEVKAPTPEEATFNGIRQYIKSERIYNCITGLACEELEKRGKFDFKGAPPNMLKTLSFHKYEENSHFYAGQVNPDTNK